MTDSIHDAMVMAQSEMKSPVLDSVNPHFKSRYASLTSVRAAVIPSLVKHGIYVTQKVSCANGQVSCDTVLTYKDGTSLSSTLSVPCPGRTPQEVGSAITYARRYGLSSLVCVAAEEDDDANAAEEVTKRSPRVAKVASDASSPSPRVTRAPKTPTEMQRAVDIFESIKDLPRDKKVSAWKLMDADTKALMNQFLGNLREKSDPAASPVVDGGASSPVVDDRDPAASLNEDIANEKEPPIDGG